MNILYLTQFFSGTGGGASLIFYDLAKSLSERGHKVFVICNVATETIDSDNFKLHLVKPFSVNTSELPSSPSHNLRYIMNSIATGIKIARRDKIDIIHTNSFTPVIAGSVISKLIGAPVVASIFDVFTTSDKSHWNNWIHYNALPSYYSTIGRIYEKISLSVPLDFIHTISNATKNDILMHRKNKPIQVVYPSIDPRKYQGAAAAPTYGNFILYIGRLVFYKNVDILIRAYKEVVELIPSAKLVIVGDGPMKNEWKSLSRGMGIENNIIFTDHISHDEKVNLLKSCCALALPSVFEGFGLVLLEAFALAKPVLVSNVPPLDEIVEDNIDGFIIAHDDPHAWARKVIELLNNRDLSKNMGAKSAEKFRYKFCFSRYIDAMENLYRQLLRRD